MAAGVQAPAWVVFQNELVATVGQTPGVFVSQAVKLDASHYIVAVATPNAARGVALATVLAGDHNLGGVDIQVIATNYAGVRYASGVVGSSSELAAFEQIALSGNRLFQQVVVHPLFPGEPDVVFPVFTKSVVQFGPGNPSDLFNRFTLVTATAFNDVLSGQVGNIDVSPSTASASATSATGQSLSPPWYTFRNELAATVGQTPGVFVTPLVQIDDSHYIVAVATPNAERGVSLATVLAGDHNFGGVDVQVIATNYAGVRYNSLPVTSTIQLAALERLALGGNPLLSYVVTPPAQPFVVFPVFTRSVVQFYDDNLADAYGNFNGVAADVFADVLSPSFGVIQVRTTTV
jgi:hypothetical protein